MLFSDKMSMYNVHTYSDKHIWHLISIVKFTEYILCIEDAPFNIPELFLVKFLKVHISAF